MRRGFCSQRVVNVHHTPNPSSIDGCLACEGFAVSIVTGDDTSEDDTCGAADVV